MRRAVSLLFTLGLLLILLIIVHDLAFGDAPMLVGKAILAAAPEALNTPNVVTTVVLAYRGLDTLGELAILFVATTGVGLVLAQAKRPTRPQASGFILVMAADILFPFLIVLGAYIILHGHITPGGGFQGGAILAAAFFIPVLANPNSPLNAETMMWVEGLAGASFVLIAGLAMLQQGQFLEPIIGTATLGDLFATGSLPLLYIAVGLKVGSELAGLLSTLADA